MALPTLFVQLVLKTYVPEEFNGALRPFKLRLSTVYHIVAHFSALIDALSDPKAYLNAQDKRKEALHHMGVDEADIVDVLDGNDQASKAGTTHQQQNGAFIASMIR